MNKKYEPFTKESILSKMINKRVKSAKRTHDRYILSNYTVSKDNKKEIQDEICKYMPSRKKWISLGELKRRKEVNSNKSGNQICFSSIDSVKKNKKRLELTIIKDSSLAIKPKYFSDLNQFIDDIIEDFNHDKLSIRTPRIIPKKKDETGKKLRPLCVFELRDNIILQEVNSFLIQNCDKYFCNCSYAFRGKMQINGKMKIPTHHDTIDKILQYRNAHLNEKIYVTEYDLKKFFDTIDHSIISKKLDLLLDEKTLQIDDFWKTRIRHVFDNYLSCYTFYDCIFSKNKDYKYLKESGFPNGEFEWVSELKKQFKKKNCKKRIGIPQGGALSGFIANLVLNEVDQKLMELNDPDLLYLRYCDDMIMLHTNKKKLKKAATIYRKVIKKNKLFVHKPTKIKKYDKNFYESKSRSIYIWGDIKENKIPWISFVGYQIGFKGEVRIRKQSIKKELDKQKKVVDDTIKQISNKQMKNPLKIIRSVIQRLQGMSVGHINLYSYDPNPSLCWITGFSKLNKNRFTIQQMKGLDKNRCKQIKRLCKYIEYKKEKNQNKNNVQKDNTRDDPEIIYSGKPFSYYAWIEKK